MVICAGNIEDFADGVKRVVSHDGLDIVVFADNGVWYAFNRECPHAKGDLSRARFEGGFATCYKHGLRYNLRSGDVDLSAVDEDLLEDIEEDVLLKLHLGTYAVEVRDGQVLLTI